MDVHMHYSCPALVYNRLRSCSMMSSGSDVSKETARLDGNLMEFEKIKEAIDNIRDVQRKQPDEDSITAYLAKLGLLNDIVSHETVSSTLGDF